MFTDIWKLLFWDVESAIRQRLSYISKNNICVLQYQKKEKTSYKIFFFFIFKGEISRFYAFIYYLGDKNTRFICCKIASKVKAVRWCSTSCVVLTICEKQTQILQIMWLICFMYSEDYQCLIRWCWYRYLNTVNIFDAKVMSYYLQLFHYT